MKNFNLRIFIAGLLVIPCLFFVLSFVQKPNQEKTSFPNAALKLTKPAINNGEFPVFTFTTDKKPKSTSILGIAFADSIQVKAEVIKRGEKEDAKVLVNPKGNGEYEITFSKANGIRSGKQTLKVTATENGKKQTFEQDFTWGVLALNPDKMTYLRNETANIAMAVLDDQGRMDCKAQLSLKVTRPDGSIEELSSADGRIQVTPQCKLYTYSKEPDYKTSFQTTQIGTYGLDLVAKTSEGTHEIKDKIKVEKDISFDIERIAPTRIYPPLQYPVGIKIKANQNFSGTVLESVPLDFKISYSKEAGVAPYSSIQNTDTAQVISWKINIKKGDRITLDYAFDSPYKSPNFYIFDPLKIVESNGSIVFTENRSFEIAIDATYTLSGTIYSNEGSTAMGNPPCDGTTAVVSLVVNNGAAVTTTCGSGTGTWTKTVTANSTDVVSIFLNASSTPKADTKVRVSATTTISGIDLYQNTLIVRAEGTSLTTADACLYIGADSLISNCTSATLTLNSNIEFHVWTGDTFDEAGDPITTQGTGNFHISTSSSAINISDSTIAGDIVIDNGGSFSDGSGPNTVNGGDITTAGTATFTAIQTITISGTGNIGGGSGAITFNSLTISSTGSTTATSDFTASGTFTISASGSFNGGSGKTVTLSSSTVTSPLVVSGTFTPNTGTIAYTGNRAVTVAATTYYNLSLIPTITLARTYTMAGATTVNNNWTINPTAATSLALTVNLGGTTSITGLTTVQGTSSGTSTLSTTGSNFALNTGSLSVLTGGTLSINTSTLSITGTGTTVTVTGTFDPSSTNSTVNYTGTTGSVTVGALTYYNLGIGTTADSNSNTFSLGGNTGVNNILTVGASSGAGVHTLSNGSSTLTLAGTTGTPFVVNSSGAFSGSSGTVTYTGNNGSGNTTITTTNTTYNNLTVNNASETYVTPATTTLTVGGGLTVTAGTFDTNTNNTPIALTGNLSNSGTLLAPPSASFTISGDFTNNGTFTHDSGTVTLNSAGTQTLAGSGTPAIAFRNLTLSGGGTVKFTVGETFWTSGTFTVSNSTNINSTTSSQWFMNSMSLSTVNAGTITNSGCAPATNLIRVTTGTNGGNNDWCWFFAQSTPQSQPTFKGTTTIKGNTTIK